MTKKSFISFFTYKKKKTTTAGNFYPPPPPPTNQHVFIGFKFSEFGNSCSEKNWGKLCKFKEKCEQQKNCENFEITNLKKINYDEYFFTNNSSNFKFK